MGTGAGKATLIGELTLFSSHLLKLSRSLTTYHHSSRIKEELIVVILTRLRGSHTMYFSDELLERSGNFRCIMIFFVVSSATVLSRSDFFLQYEADALRANARAVDCSE